MVLPLVKFLRKLSQRFLYVFHQERIKEFMVAVDKLSDMQKKTQLENRKLIALRDFLLPMLMNGQVTFRQ